MRTRLPGDVHAPAAARRYVTTHLEPVLVVGTRPLCDDVVLVVSELVANSVRAGAREIEVALRVQPGRLVLQVADDADGWPAPRSASVDDPDGRGLAIVEALTDHWEASARRRGKTVTATWWRDDPPRSRAARAGRPA